MTPALSPHTQAMLDYWRGRAEAEIRGSGLDYTIIRAGGVNQRATGKTALGDWRARLAADFSHPDCPR